MRIEKLKISPFTLPGAVKKNHPSSFKGNKALSERLLKTKKANEIVAICKSNNPEIGEYEYFLVFLEKRELREALSFLNSFKPLSEKAEFKDYLEFLVKSDNLLPLCLLFQNKNIPL